MITATHSQEPLLPYPNTTEKPSIPPFAPLTVEESPTPFFEVKDLSHPLGFFTDLSLSLQKNEILFISGPSGCGKSTLLKYLALLDTEASFDRQIFLQGSHIKNFKAPEWRSRVCLVSQTRVDITGSPKNFFRTILEYNAQKRRCFSSSSSGPSTVVESMEQDLINFAEEMNLPAAYLDHEWTKLSGGESQRATIAIALALKPSVLLLDEPTAALDPDSKVAVERLVKQFTNGVVVWVTHDAPQIDRVGGKVLKFNRQADLGTSSGASGSSDFNGSSGSSNNSKQAKQPDPSNPPKLSKFEWKNSTPKATLSTQETPAFSAAQDQNPSAKCVPSREFSTLYSRQSCSRVSALITSSTLAFPATQAIAAPLENKQLHQQSIQTLHQTTSALYTHGTTVLSFLDKASFYATPVVFNYLYTVRKAKSELASPPLSFLSVFLAWITIFFPIYCSYKFKIGLETRFLIGSLRCFLQLSLLGYILLPIFAYNHFFLTFVYLMTMCLIAANEAVARAVYFYDHLFRHALTSLAVSTFLHLLYALFVVEKILFLDAKIAIPITGMLLGNSLTAVSVSVTTGLTELVENKHRFLLALACGADRWEACTPLIKQTAVVALTSTINTLNVAGLVSIPGMMTGQLLGGSDPEQAAKSQIVILILLLSCSSMSIVFITYFCVDQSLDSHSFVLDRLRKRDSTVDSKSITGFINDIFNKIISFLSNIFNRNRNS